MKKQFLQLGVRIDQKLNRSEKTVALPLELERIGGFQTEIELFTFFLMIELNVELSM